MDLHSGGKREKNEGVNRQLLNENWKVQNVDCFISQDLQSATFSLTAQKAPAEGCFASRRDKHLA